MKLELKESYYWDLRLQVLNNSAMRPRYVPPDPFPRFSETWHEAPVDPGQRILFDHVLYRRIAGLDRKTVERQIRRELKNYGDTVTRELAEWLIELFWSLPWVTWDHTLLALERWLGEGRQSCLTELVTLDLVDPELRARRPYISLLDEYRERDRVA